MLTNGVTVLAAVPIPTSVIEAILHDVGSRAGAERMWPEDEDALGTLAFAAGAGAALTIVRRETPQFAAGRTDLVTLLGAPVADVLRVEVMVPRGDVSAFARADAALVGIAARIAHAFCALVADDVGSVYDPDELARLDDAGALRAVAFSYQLAAARRAVAGRIPDLIPPPISRTSTREAPSDRQPDGSTDGFVSFSVPGPHVALATLVRIVLALAGDARANPARLPVRLFAPAIAAADGLRLAACGVDLRVTAPEAATTREAVDVFSRARLSDEAVAAIVDGRPRAPLAAAEPGFPHQIASIDAGDGTVTVSTLDLATADAALSTFVRSRAALVELLGGIGSVVSIEYAAGAPASDALAARLASAFVADGGGLAAHASGAVYGPDELAGLERRSRGFAGSWSARIAATQIASSAE